MRRLRMSLNRLTQLTGKLNIHKLPFGVNVLPQQAGSLDMEVNASALKVNM